MKPDSPFYSICFNALRLSPLFSCLDEKTLQGMLLQFHRETWMKNSPAMDSSRTINRFYVIISGRMKVCRINPDTGRELTIFLLGPGDVFDVICLLDYQEHEVEVTAIDDLETMCAPLGDIRNWIRQHPEFNRTFLPYLGNQIRSLEELATDLTLHDTCTRLARLIIRHVDHKQPQNRLNLIHDLSHEELANMIGSVRAVVNRHMQVFKKEGVLETSRKHIKVKDSHSLLNRIEKRMGLR